MASHPMPPPAAEVFIDEQGRFIRVKGRSFRRQNSRARVDVLLNTEPPKVPDWVEQGKGINGKS